MKLEDLTKEELINFIRTDWRLRGAKEETIVRDCLYGKMTKIQKQLEKSSNKLIDLLEEYSDFWKPYETFADIPETELKKGVKIERALKQAKAEEEEIRKQYDKLNKLLF